LAWSVELTGILWLLEQIEQGNLSVGQARQQLLVLTDWESGCCDQCDGIVAEWPTVLAQQRARRAEWKHWFASITPDSHPYIFNSGKTKIHRWDCARVAITPPVTDSPLLANTALHRLDERWVAECAGLGVLVRAVLHSCPRPVFRAAGHDHLDMGDRARGRLITLVMQSESPGARCYAPGLDRLG
jgi:hypothetical protein